MHVTCGVCVLLVMSTYVLRVCRSGGQHKEQAPPRRQARLRRHRPARAGGRSARGCQHKERVTSRCASLAWRTASCSTVSTAFCTTARRCRQGLADSVRVAACARWPACMLHCMLHSSMHAPCPRLHVCIMDEYVNGMCYTARCWQGRRPRSSRRCPQRRLGLQADMSFPC